MDLPTKPEERHTGGFQGPASRYPGPQEPSFLPELSGNLEATDGAPVTREDADGIRVLAESEPPNFNPGTPGPDFNPGPNPGGGQPTGPMPENPQPEPVPQPQPPNPGSPGPGHPNPTYPPTPGHPGPGQPGIPPRPTDPPVTEPVSDPAPVLDPASPHS